MRLNLLDYDRWPLTFFFFLERSGDGRRRGERAGGTGRSGIRGVRFNASRLIGSRGRGRESSESRGHGGTNRFIRELYGETVEPYRVERWKEERGEME